MNIFICFTCIGTWHGASWTFVSSGMYYGFFIICESLLKINERNFTWKGKIIQHIYLLLIVTFGLIRFRSETLEYSFQYAKNMFGLVPHEEIICGPYCYGDKFEWIILIIAIICSMPLFKNMLNWGQKHCFLGIVLDSWIVILLFCSCMQLAASTYNPFIYFRF